MRLKRPTVNDGRIVIDGQVLAIQGNCLRVVRDAATGRIVHRQRRKNKVPASGLNLICDLLKGDTVLYLSYFGLGTDTAIALSTNTTLGTEVYRASITSMSRTGGVLTVNQFIPTTAANGNSITEAGIFNASASGTLFARVIHAAIAKTASLTITYQWVFTFTAVT